MKVLITGSTGFIGTALCESLSASGHEVVRLVRLVRRQSAEGRTAFAWNPKTGYVDPAALAGCDGVIHLAGENIAAGRWTNAKKARIRNSRVYGTRTLCNALAAADLPPKVLVSASAIGYYGHRADETLDEQATAGDGFLPEVCEAWEAETRPAADKGIRVVRMRTGVVLSANGGALAKMLIPFPLGVGGTIGSGRQYMSWIGLDDLVAAFTFALENETLHGPVNTVAPNPVTNREFTKTLGKVLRRPTLLPLPTFVARIAFGEMADALLLASTRVIPKRLTDAQFQFAHPQLESSLRHVLCR